MADIFLSYSRKDAKFRDRLVKDLEFAGFTVWTDVGLEPGTPSWTEAIEREIEHSGCMVVLLSPSSKASKWVGREIHYGQLHEKTIIPVLIKGKRKSVLPIDIVSTQLVDLRTQYGENLQALISTLKNRIKQTLPTEPLPAADSFVKPIWPFSKPRIKLKATNRADLQKHIIDAFSVDRIMLVDIGKLDCAKHANGYRAVVLFEKSEHPYLSQWDRGEKRTYRESLVNMGFKSHTRSTLFESQTKTQKYETITVAKEWPLSANIADVANDIIDANLIMGLAIGEIEVSYLGKKGST